jgi:endonuclease/exonuclease/phosphatase family metal-dependent hydrolase
VKVLTYNLFWWNLFDKREGNYESAGHLIADTSGPEQYDILAFQECDDRDRIMHDAKHQGLHGEYETIDGDHAIALAFRKSRFQLLEHGSEEVGEDSKDQYYGRRSAQWARLLHRDGIVVFFVNHHGPLRVSEDGGCTGLSVALNIMQVIAGNAHPDDRIVLVGDFNAEPWSSRISELDKRLHRVFSGTRMGGVDHIYTNCNNSVATRKNIGTGGSDHDALSITFKF